MPRVAFVFFLHFWAQRLTLLPSDFAQRDDVASTLVGLRFNDATLIVLDCLLITWYTFYFHFKGKVLPFFSAFVVLTENVGYWNWFDNRVVLEELLTST